MEFVEEQKRVLELEDKNIIVSASAGSGKTFTMLSKVFHIMKNKKLDISKIMLLTYTNFAGNEMKIKLYKMINENIAKNEDREFLISQIDSLSSSTISTFHSFYEKIIREYYYKLNINPSFSVVTGENLEILKNKAFLLAIKKFEKERRDDVNEILDEFSSKRDYGKIRTLIFSLHEFLSALDDENSWKNNFACKIYENPSLIKDIIENHLKALVELVNKKFDALFKKARELDEEDVLKNISACQVELETFNRLTLEEKVKNKVVFPRFMKKDVSEQLKAELKAIKEFFNSSYLKLKLDETSFENFEEKLLKTKRDIKILLDLYDEFASEFENIKEKENSLDFSSLEKLAFSLLKDEQTRKAILDKFQFVFVDEYQDVNKIQDAIVKLLGTERKVFLVGDPKQSIYAFRQSDVELFNEKEKEFNKDLNSQSLSLKSNFRSNSEILDFCNVVFSNLITKKTMGIDYKNDAMFDAKSKIESVGDVVNLLFCTKEEKERKEEQQEIYSIKNSQIEESQENLQAICVLEKISKLLKEEIYDEKLSARRKITFGDIAVLFRNRGDFSKTLINLFNKFAVPYTFNDKYDLKQSKIILAFVSLFKLCFNVYDDVDIVNVLLRFFDVSINDINNLVVENDYIEISKILTLSKFQSVNEFISKIKSAIELEGICFAVNKIISETEILKGFESQDEKELEDFLKFVKENSYNNNVIDLIMLFETAESVLVEVNEECGQNKVVLSTIHSSKGLEYPIVFLGDMSRPCLQKNSGQMIVDKNLGVFVKDVLQEKTSPVLTVLKLEAYKKQISEEIRLLYVALTRAKNMLFMCGNQKEDFEEINENNILFSEIDYLGFVVGSLGSKIINKIEEGKNFKQNNINFEYFKNKNDNLAPFEGEKDLKFNEEIINKYNNFTYKFENAAQKTTVTNLNSEDNISNFNSSPKKLEIYENEQVENNLETGVLYHSILEKIDFSKDNFEEQIENILSKIEISNKGKIKNDILAIVKNVKTIVKNGECFKEKEFMLYVSPKEILGEGSENCVLIQGKIDLFSIGEKVVLIDYKYSNLTNDKLIAKYQKQLKIYAFALENSLKRKVDEIYLLNIKNNSIINLSENKK